MLRADECVRPYASLAGTDSFHCYSYNVRSSIPSAVVGLYTSTCRRLTNISRL